jgi:benzoyl-CoA reductase/2-hydroxyglutaryl-CoA dehydratase subunit BcrC/BadD/HgdB
LPNPAGNVSLNGYFQSLKYFENYKYQFIDQLILPEVNCSIIKDGSVAFHIRRGDYLRYPDIHLVCDTKYFNDMFERFKDHNINVFTDSPQHVLNEFEKYNFNLIQTSSELNDLTLMSLHDNIVCSNSSFSWWASILGIPKNTVIVPNRWFNDRVCEDIYYDFMERV